MDFLTNDNQHITLPQEMIADSIMLTTLSHCEDDQRLPRLEACKMDLENLVAIYNELPKTQSYNIPEWKKYRLCSLLRTADYLCLDILTDYLVEQTVLFF